MRGADIVGTPLASFGKILATCDKHGSVQRLLRRRIRQRAGLRRCARPAGFAKSRSSARNAPRIVRRIFRAASGDQAGEIKK